MPSRGLNTGDNLLNCPIMIVGAGPAGISTWLNLQEQAPQLARHSIVIEKAFSHATNCVRVACVFGYGAVG